MKISIFGLGYVGAVSMACLARDGHQVVGVDLDPLKLDLIRSGRSPIVEEGIQELTAQVVASGRVQVTDDVAAAVRETELSFICVGTPSSPNGSQDLSAVRRVSEQIGAALKDKPGYHTVVMRSTIQPGSMAEVVQAGLEATSGKKAGVDFGLGFQPEFLREGTSIKDYDNPPFTVIGTDDPRAADVLRQVFGHLDCEFVVTSIGVAEMLKYACNAFHALKITFANEIGRLARSVGVDGRDVMELVCKDTRLNISKAYLKPGFAFGGSCLPKDLRALTYVGKLNDVTTPMLGNVMGSNRAHIDHAFDLITQSGKRRIGMIGLSFKAGTDDLRESPLVTVAKRLIGEGYDLRIYDPEVNLSRLIGANKRYIEQSIPHIGSLMADDCESTIEHAEVLVVGLNDAAITTLVAARLRPDQQVVDLVGLARSSTAVHADGYAGVCW
ncbi:MAG TPA: UDP-glucose/GDP-mannose dehydrogenase family protein [Steroidobacteraceae bacterium]|nr:UDP-glucose/GDP-mannose dehydrogenase family protein [Steroidobacteraceae bacterium]